MTTTPALHSHRVRLSYGDTDPAGILYYAAWFHKMEALQSEFLFLQGIRQDELKNDFGWWTVTRATECEYLVTAELYDEIIIELRLGKVGVASFTLEYEMWRVSDDAKVARASLTIVTTSSEQSAIRIPETFRTHLEQWATGNVK